MRYWISTFSNFITLVIFLAISQIGNAQNPNPPIEINISEGCDVKGSTVCIDFTANNFTLVQSIDFIISFNAKILKLVTPINLSNSDFPGIGTSLFTDYSNFPTAAYGDGNIRFLYFDGDAVTIPNGGRLFTLCFELIGDPGYVSPIFINQGKVDLEVIQGFDPLNPALSGPGVTTVTNGSIKIKSNTLVISANHCDATNAALDNGSISFLATGGVGPYSYTVNGGSAVTGLLDGELVLLSDLPEGSYTILVTGSDGLSTTNTVTIASTLPFTYTIDPVNPTCAHRATPNGSMTVNITDGGAFSISSYGFAWSNFEYDINEIKNLPSGTYTVTITDIAGCSKIETATINVDPIIYTVTTVDPLCAGIKDGSITVVASGGNGGPYKYYLDGILKPTNVFAGLDAGIHKIRVGDNTPSGCTTLDDEITLSYSRVLSFDTKLEPVTCFGLNDGVVEITASPILAYTFTLVGGAVDSDLNNIFAVDTLVAGDYTVNAVDQNGCKDAILFTIKEPTPIVVIPAVVQPGCSTKGSITLSTSGGTVGAGSYTYTWDPLQPANVSRLTDLDGGTYSVTVMDDNSCFETFTTTLNPSGSLAITPNIQQQISCTGQKDGILFVDILSSAGPFVIRWLNASQDTVGVGQTLLNAGFGVYDVIVKAADGCSNRKSITIDEPAPFSFTGDVLPASCANTAGSATINIIGNPAGYTFSWVQQGDPAVLSTANVLSAKAGQYLVTVTNANGCTKDTVVNIIAPSPLTFPVPETRNVICFGDSTGQAAILSSPVGLTYRWSSGSNGVFAINLPTGQNWVIGSNGTCTSDTTFFNVGTNPMLRIDTLKTMSTNPTCFGSTDGSILIEAIGGTGVGYTYTWPDLGTTGNNLNNISAGTYMVELTDSNNCVATDSFTLIQPDSLVVSLNNALSIFLDCNNQNQGKLSLSTAGGNIGIKTYTWSPGVTANKETASGLSAGIYCATVSDSKGCVVDTCFELIAPVPLEGDLNIPDDPACFGGKSCISVDFLTGGTPGNYTFQINNGTRFPIDTCVAVFAGTYFVNLIDASGCSINKTITINQPDPLSVDLGEDREIQLGVPAPLISAVINNSAPLDTLIWTPTDSLTCAIANCQTVLLNPAVTTTYLLTATDINGCTGTDEITINVKDVRNVYFANIFSPNRDGNNDFFQVVVGPGVERIESFLIFDRWGNKVFEQINYIPDPAGSDGWDGTFNGKFLDPGVFVYYVNARFIDGRNIEYSGSVTLAEKVRN